MSPRLRASSSKLKIKDGENRQEMVKVELDEMIPFLGDNGEHEGGGLRRQAMHIPRTKGATSAHDFTLTGP